MPVMERKRTPKAIPNAKWVLGRAKNAGRTAAVHGKPYSANPFDRQTQPEQHLAWSEAHNGMRARLFQDRYEN